VTQQEFFQRFSLDEWQLLCSKIEFLDVFAADPFDSELAEAVAKRILNFDSPAFPSPLGN
jgi:hypothetical protein